MLKKPPRWSLAALSVSHAAIFLWAGAVLPWGQMTAFTAATFGMVGAYSLTAVLAALRHRVLGVVWRASSAMAVAYFLYLLWGLVASAVHVRGLYAGLGDGIAAALIAVCLIPALFTLPFGFWGLAATGGVERPRLVAGTLLLAVLFAIFCLWRAQQAAVGVRIATPQDTEELVAAIERGVFAEPRPQAVAGASLHEPNAVDCPQAPGEVKFTAVATYAVKLPPKKAAAKKKRKAKRKRKKKGKRRAKKPRLAARSICAQGDDMTAVAKTIAEAVRSGVGPSFKLDVVVAGAPLPAPDELLAPLAMRPGQDGICAGSRCLMPWQLVVHDVFTSQVIVRAVPDARLGVSQAVLRKLLGEPEASLWRFETLSLLLGAKGRREVGRSRPLEPLSEAGLEEATKLAHRYVLKAQQKTGRFRYMVDPFTGRNTPAGRLSIARHAGTLLALCELGPRDKTTNRAAKRTARLLASLEHFIGDDKAVLRPPNTSGKLERLGPSALSLAALIRCRDRTGKAYDRLLGRLARTLLGQQRRDGSFAHQINADSGQPHVARSTLYAEGQMVLGLVLLEAIAAESDHFPPVDRLRLAVNQAMDWAAERYWSHFAGQLFFIEENWHCIAAAAALGHHRHDGYERFCLDYVKFKSRLIYRPDSDVHPDFVGGYGVGSIVPPHNTPTAGFGEALAAGIAIKKARGEELDSDIELMRLVLARLMSNQWRKDSCWACSPRHHIIGGFSEHPASPRIRIDYVQHAWAALGHGGRAIGLFSDS